jgi:hypothetical protein
MPFTGKQKDNGRSHLLSLRNVAHSANDGTAVFFCPDAKAPAALPGEDWHLPQARDFNNPGMADREDLKNVQ